MFVGREEQLGQLKDLWRKPVASLVTCRGRRRISRRIAADGYFARIISAEHLLRIEN